MKTEARSRFLYVTLIRTTREKLWEALTEPRLVRQYWFDMTIVCDWKNGSPWKMVGPDGTLIDSGQVLEIEPLQRMVIHWQNEWKPELKAEGPSRCTMELAQFDRAVKLTLTHEMDRPESRLISTVSEFWPLILSNLKSLLETGEVAVTAHPGH